MMTNHNGDVIVGSCGVMILPGLLLEFLNLVLLHKDLLRKRVAGCTKVPETKHVAVIIRSVTKHGHT